MKVIGITGGVGMGKSFTAQLLQARGLRVVDTDDLARELVEPGQPALAEVQRLFGNDVVGSDGRLLREVLARRVFAEPEARRQLEAILHPRIRQLWRARMQAWAAEGCPLAVVIIPLLFETGAEPELDATVCVACSAASQHRRLHQRGWSDEQIQQRLGSQWPINQKMEAADYVIWTEGGQDLHAAQLERVNALIPNPE